MPRLFITGTDTSVGKTIVTGLLGRATGRPVVKPLASGLEDAGPDDPTQLQRLTGQVPRVFQTWGTPLAPHRAALLERAPLDEQAFERWLHALPADALVEGVGGWKVPISPRLHVPWMAEQVGKQVLVVAANRLGVLNHCQLTVDAVQAGGFAVLAVVLTPVGPGHTQYNLADLGAVLDVPLVPLPYVDLCDDKGIDLVARDLVNSIDSERRLRGLSWPW